MKNPFASEMSVGVLIEALARVDRELAKLTARRMQILARLDELTNSDGENGRVVAGMVAGASRCSKQQADGELALARKLAKLPAVSEALEKGEVSVAQVGLVAQVAEAGDEERALALASLGDNRQLEREAQAKRRDAAELHRRARDGRFVSFKDEPGGTSMSMFAKGPWGEMAGLKALLEKYARQLQRGSGAAKEPFSARMFDALMLVTGQNTAAVVNAAMTESEATGRTEGKGANSTRMGLTDVARVFTKVRANAAGAGRTGTCGESIRTDGEAAGRASSGSVAVADCDNDNDNNNNDSRHDRGSGQGNHSSGEPAVNGGLFFGGPQSINDSGLGGQFAGLDLDEEPFPDTTDDRFEAIIDELFPDECFPNQSIPDRADLTAGPATSANASAVLVTRADTKLIVHWDATTGIVNYENGPPLAHARLEALLCDAVLEVVHYSNGSPNGIVTYQRTVNDRQANYLAQRDGRCRTPGCPAIGHTHAHHIDHWPITFVTPTHRLVNVCNYCHSSEHDGRLAISGEPEGTLTFTFADGRVLRSTARPTTTLTGRASRSDDPG